MQFIYDYVPSWTEDIPLTAWHFWRVLAGNVINVFVSVEQQILPRAILLKIQKEHLILQKFLVCAIV